TTQVCKGGICAIGMCNQGFFDCNNKAADGCEANPDNDPVNCGKCGAACPDDVVANLHQYETCSGGVCQGPHKPGKCKPGWASCDNNPGNGCELPVANDPNNCGGCNVVCPNNTPYCADGGCTASTHSIAYLTPDFNAPNPNNCADASDWYTQNL